MASTILIIPNHDGNTNELIYLILKANSQQTSMLEDHLIHVNNCLLFLKTQKYKFARFEFDWQVTNVNHIHSILVKIVLIHYNHCLQYDQ